MEIGGIRQTAPVAFGSDTVRPVAPVAGTEAVQPAAKPGDSSGSERDGSTGQGDLRDRKVFIDTDTQQIVVQAVDSTTGEVLGQAPDQAILRRRAYLIQQDERSAHLPSDAPNTTVRVERRV